jgi:hypothetical protein
MSQMRRGSAAFLGISSVLATAANRQIGSRTVKARAALVICQIGVNKAEGLE